MANTHRPLHNNGAGARQRPTKLAPRLPALLLLLLALQLVLAPAALVIAVRMARRYVRTGTCRPTRAEERMLYAMIAVLILFGIARNVPALQCLRPV